MKTTLKNFVGTSYQARNLFSHTVNNYLIRGNRQIDLKETALRMKVVFFLCQSLFIPYCNASSA